MIVRNEQPKNSPKCRIGAVAVRRIYSQLFIRIDPLQIPVLPKCFPLVAGLWGGMIQYDTL